MKNEKRTVFRFPFFYENEKQMKVLKIQRKNLLNMKMVFEFRYRILNFIFQNLSKQRNGTLGKWIPQL